MTSKVENREKPSNPLKRWFRSKRVSPGHSEDTSASETLFNPPESQTTQIATHVNPSKPTSTGHVAQVNEPSSSTRTSKTPVPSASDEPVNSATSSNANLSAPNSTSLAAYQTSNLGQSAGKLPKGQSTIQRKDLWSRAVSALNPETLQKWQFLELSAESTAPDPNTITKAQSVSEVLNSARERTRLQQNKVWKQRWVSLVKSISVFKSLIDAGLTFDPTGYGKLAWSIVSFGLDAAVSGVEIDEMLAGGCEYIRATIEEYAVYEARYLSTNSSGRDALETCIVDIYEAIITYAAEMNYYIHHRMDRFNKAVQGSSESVFIKMKAVIEERKTTARTIISDIRNEISESHFQDLQSQIDAILAKTDILSRITQFIDHQERQQILTWISGMQMDAVHVSQRDKAEADDRQSPGDWILSNAQYLKWHDADVTSALWLSSGVGTGKTILTSTVIETCRKNSSGPLAYFYCSNVQGNDTTEMVAENMLRCLLRQFATHSEVTLSIVAIKWKQITLEGARTLTRLEVLELLKRIIEDDQTLEARIIIDGLDELNVDALHILLNSFDTLLRAKRGILKLFASSRWVQRIEDIFARYFRINDLVTETRNDMEIYIETAVNAQVRGRQSLDSDLVDEIKKILLDRAQGMFRYIELAIKYIFDSTTNRIREKLEDLPYPASGEAVLRPMYDKLYEELESEDSVERLLAYRIMQWLLHQLQPLTDEALLRAVCFGLDDTDSIKLRRSRPGIDEVRAACHHLVVHNSATGCFEFGHISVVEYIHWKNPPALGEVEAHSTLAAACMNFLAHEESVTTRSKWSYDDDDSFEYYSHVAWVWHWHEVSQHTPSTALQNIFDELWTSESRLQASIDTVHSIGSEDPPFTNYDPQDDSTYAAVYEKWYRLTPVLIAKSSTPLQQRLLLACAQDFPAAVDNILERNSTNLDEVAFVPGIKLALAFGSVRVLELVNSTYFAFNDLHAKGTSLLHHAANLQNAQATQKCLELFPDAVNLISFGALDDRYKLTPLLMALQPEKVVFIRHGLSKVVKLFLDRPELDFEIVDYKGRPIQHLVMEAHLGHDIMDTLLKMDPRAILRRDIDGQSSLMIASHQADHHRQEAMYLKILAQRYPAYDLHQAARVGETDRLNEILHQYNKIGSATGPDLLQALFFAVENQNMECTRLILKSPYVNVNDQDQGGFSALMIATIAGSEYAVTKLRLQGANVTLETSAGRNALFFAVRAKRLAILKKLLLSMTQSVFDINHKDSKTGRTLLHYACEYIEKDQMDYYRASREDFLHEILTHKPDVSIKDRDGRTARDIAKMNRYTKLTDLLDSAGASAGSTTPLPSPGSLDANKRSIMSRSNVSANEIAYRPVIDVNSFYSFESVRDLFHILSESNQLSESSQNENAAEAQPKFSSNSGYESDDNAEAHDEDDSDDHSNAN